MKVATESQVDKEVWVKPMEFELQKGLIGFPEAKRFELLVNPEEAPFMWIRSVDRPELGFIVIEPAEAVEGYAIEIPDDDVTALSIQSAEDALVFTIVTIRDGESIDAATVNLVGPIVLNRKTLVGRQLVPLNYMKYSARHPILSESVDS